MLSPTGVWVPRDPPRRATTATSSRGVTSGAVTTAGSGAVSESRYNFRRWKGLEVI